MEAYSKEFRRDVQRACDAGGGTREVALRFDVSESRSQPHWTGLQQVQKATPRRSPMHHRSSLETLRTTARSLHGNCIRHAGYRYR